jgi:glycosyltransferase involved in cell wall biosynthesis
MPARNVGNYVGAAIDAVLDDMEVSGIERFRLMVVDDASTDHTGAVIANYANHPNIEIFTNPYRRGIARTRALLLEETYSQAVAPLAIANRDADDITIPGTAETLLTLLEAEEAQLVGGAMLRFFDDDPSITTPIHRLQDEQLTVERLLRGHAPAWNPTVVYDAAFYRQLGKPFPDQDYGEDVLHQADIIHGGGRIVNSPEPVVHYRKHSGSQTTGWHPENAMMYWKMCRHIWSEAPVAPTPRDRAFVAARFVTLGLMSEQSDVYQHLRTAFRLFTGHKPDEPTLTPQPFFEETA